MHEQEIVERFRKAQESLVIQQSDFSLMAIYQMVTSGSIDITPHYQRRDRWSSEKQSALIESFLLNVPVPPVYLSEDEYGTYSVIDGKQRITAICEFLGGKLKLRSLKEFPELEGFTFEDLPLPLRNVLIMRPYIRVTTLLKQSNESLKYEVFLRLNTGGERLKPQEIRNVAYSGRFNDLLFELSSDPFLCERMKITSDKSPSYRSMDDIEHVLRFFTIQSSWEAMSGVLGEEMDYFMAKNRHENPNYFRELFTRAIRGVESIWGEYAFQKPTSTGWREQFISPLYDAEMVAVSLFEQGDIDAISLKRQEVIEATRQLFEFDQDFVKSVSQSTNNASSIRKRVETLGNLLANVLQG